MEAYGVGKDGRVHPPNKTYQESFLCSMCNKVKLLIEKNPKDVIKTIVIEEEEVDIAMEVCRNCYKEYKRSGQWW